MSTALTTTASVLAWYRRFLLGTATAVYLGAALELWLVEHTEDLLQWLPFIVIALGLAAIGWRVTTSTRASLRAIRWTGVLAVLSSLLGVVLHVRGNYLLQREVDPSIALGEALWDALSGGNPFLAPGMVALAGLLAAAATYRARHAP